MCISFHLPEIVSQSKMGFCPWCNNTQNWNIGGKKLRHFDLHSLIRYQRSVRRQLAIQRSPYRSFLFCLLSFCFLFYSPYLCPLAWSTAWLCIQKSCIAKSFLEGQWSCINVNFPVNCYLAIWLRSCLYCVGYRLFSTVWTPDSPPFLRSAGL